MRGRERGNASMLVMAAVVLCGLLCIATARLGAAARDKAAANTAADAAALAAAGVLARGGSSRAAEAVARHAASANGARLLSCRCAAGDALVVVEVGGARARARARADEPPTVSRSARFGHLNATESSDLWHGSLRRRFWVSRPLVPESICRERPGMEAAAIEPRMNDDAHT